MARGDPFSYGVLAGMLLMVGADAIRWFITQSAHPSASPTRTIAVALQALIAFGAAVGIWLAYRRSVRRSNDG